MKKMLFISLLITFVISSCGPSEKDIQKAIAQTLAAYTPTRSFTKTPAPTNTPKNTYTPRPTNTARPSPTAIAGTFGTPLHIGDSIKLPVIPEKFRKDPNNNGGEVEFQLLEAKRGQDAKAEAQKSLSYYQEPINGQEYIAVRGLLRILSYFDNNRVWPLLPYWHLTLRYEDGGNDIWSADAFYKVAEGYPPIEGEFWILFLARQNSEPFLYFQPSLITQEQLGIRTSGVYFDLFGQP